MKAYWGVEVRYTHSWPRHWMEVSCQLHTMATLPPGKKPLVPTGKGARWAAEKVWRKIPSPCRDSKPRSSASRTALGPTQLPTQWVPRVLSLGAKRPGREADHSPPSSAKLREWVALYFHSPYTPSWRGAQLKKYRDNFTFRKICIEWCPPSACIFS
jgi:hypothetical protein